MSPSIDLVMVLGSSGSSLAATCCSLRNGTFFFFFYSVETGFKEIKRERNGRVHSHYFMSQH